MYAISYPDPVRTELISTTGGVGARWSRDGSDLFYLTPTGELMLVSVEETGFSSPRLRFEVRGASGSVAVSADAERFLINAPVDPDPSLSIHVVLNWFEELQQRVPGGR